MQELTFAFLGSRTYKPTKGQGPGGSLGPRTALYKIKHLYVQTKTGFCFFCNQRKWYHGYFRGWETQPRVQKCYAYFSCCSQTCFSYKIP